MTEKYEVSYSPAALDDLRTIYSYIAYECSSPTNAQNQLNRIRKKIRSLDTFPERYQKTDIPPWADREVHRLPVDHYIIFYQIDFTEFKVIILRIVYEGKELKRIWNSLDI